MKPIITVVTGTYNRLLLLQRMISSARASVLPTIRLDFVVVDGGSGDGTQAWAKTQPDITLIEQGALFGAIRAFCDGAAAATGEYVLLANDDVEFVGNGITRALLHIEQNERCGAVAFQDNRPTRFAGESKYKVQLQRAFAADGKPTAVPYAQVGLFRRWLGDAIGWWGKNDPIMAQAHTYGGDNWLSARIWELGYTVDMVSGAICNDLVAPDLLREVNERKERGNPAVFYRAYPNGHGIADTPKIANPQTERLRVLYLPIYEPGSQTQKRNKRGLREALVRRGALVYEIDYLNDKTDLVSAVDLWQPHLILTQMHDARNLPATTLAEMRRHKPDAVIVNWNGDARGLTEPDYLDLLKHVDLQLTVNAAPFPVYNQRGIRCAYWQIGYEEADALPDAPAHDVVFLGSCYNEARKELESVLMQLRADGLDVGIYGSGWQAPNGENLYEFGAPASLYQRAKVAISDKFTDGKTECYGFVSNRFVQALHAGAVLLQQHIDGLDELNGTQAGVHYFQWKALKDLPKLIRRVIAADDHPVVRRAAHDFAVAHLSFDAQLDRLFDEILPILEGDHATA